MNDDEFVGVIVSAETAAALLVTRLKSDCLGKITGPADAAECLRKLVAAKGELAFRRPLGDDEIGHYMNLAIANLDTTPGGRDAAFALSFAAIFSSPHFLYRAEVGEGKTDSMGRKRLSAYELAIRGTFEVCAAGCVRRPCCSGGCCWRIGRPIDRNERDVHFGGRLRLDECGWNSRRLRKCARFTDVR